MGGLDLLGMRGADGRCPFFGCEEGEVDGGGGRGLVMGEGGGDSS